MKLTVKNISEGKCPYCDSENVYYGKFEIDDCGGHYDTFCLDCQRSFKEHYDFVFAGHGLFDKDCSFVAAGSSEEIELNEEA